MTWMDPENIRLSEITRHKRTNLERFHLHEAPGIGKFIEKVEERLLGAGARGMGRFCLMSRGSVWNA